TVKVVLVDDGKVLGKSLVPAGMDTGASTQQAYDEALASAGLDSAKVENVMATGTGRKECVLKNQEITEVGAAAKGALNRLKSCRTVVDVGAEEGRSIRCDEKGKVIDFAFNEKCAAGAGTFAEGMARALQVSLEELGPLSLKSKQAVQMNAQCAVFAESEVVTLIHNKTPREDIARAVLDAVASRIISMVRKVGFEKDVMLIGGMALNPGFVAAMNRGLEMDVHVPEDCEYIGALGAALAAQGQSN
ncbi:MAG TPA: acyl-CoA dehydratase activase, partial [Phycisphaerae bacterium]|nr:acyl-CoA dehydratase activase [Phycisphaerae bacterium]